MNVHRLHCMVCICVCIYIIMIHSLFLYVDGSTYQLVMILGLACSLKEMIRREGHAQTK